MHLQTLDYTVVIIYGIFLLILAQWVSREEAGHEKNTQDYFLAGRALPWWAIGASLIAANISAEQIIGMSGSAYVLGVAIASYEWMAAITLIIVGKYLLPVFLKHKIYTMPQFLEQRFDHRVRMVMATFWLGVYVFVNLTSILWLGSLTINSVTGLEQTYGMVIIGLFAISYSLYGGLKAVALTDIIQVVLLVFGGLLIAWISMNEISGGQGAIAGFVKTLEVVPEKFDMIFTKDIPHYDKLPGISVLIGGMWIMNLSYWGFNQYIIQRALAAKDTREAQKGIVFAAFLKMLIPVLVVVPGIAAGRPERPGFRSIDRCHRLLTGFDDQQHFDHFYDGHVPAFPARRHIPETPGDDRPYGCLFGHDHRNDRREASFGQFRPGFSIYPGVHRILHTGYRCYLPAGLFLETHHGKRRAGCSHRFRGPVAWPEVGLACAALHRPGWPGLPALHGHRDADLAMGTWWRASEGDRVQ